MNQREITTNGWTVDDHRGAERLRTERGMARMVIFDEVDTYRTEATPYITVGVDMKQETEVRTYLMRPGADGVTSEEVGFPFTEPTP